MSVLLCAVGALILGESLHLSPGAVIGLVMLAVGLAPYTPTKR